LAVYPGGYSKFALHKRPHGLDTTRVEEVLRLIRPYIRNKANEHFALVGGNDAQLNNLRGLFQIPPLGTRPEIQIQSKSPDKKEKYRRDFDELLKSESNIIFLGEREVGKTSLAHFIAINVSEGLCDRPRIPIIFDAHTLPKAREIRRLIRSYLGDFDGPENLIHSVERCDLLIIVDNLTLTDRSQLSILERLRSDNPRIRWMCFVDLGPEHYIYSPELPTSLKGFEGLFIHTLPRRAIRQISQSWCRVTGSDGTKTFSRIMEHISNSQLPKTGYIVSLLL
jgi:hypothetical protein